MVRMTHFEVLALAVVLLATVLPLSAVEAQKSAYGQDKVFGIDESSFAFEERNGETIVGTLYTPITLYEEKLPAIVFVGGLWTRVEDYTWITRRLASDGYIVLSMQPEGQDESTGTVQAPELMDWVNNTQDAITALISAEGKIIDKERIGVAGHSCGAFAALVTGLIDNRVKAVVSLAPINFFLPQATDFADSDHEAAIQIQDGPADFLTAIPTNAIRIYNELNGIKELITITGALESHEMFVNLDIAGMPWDKKISYNYAKAWFDYYLKNEQAAFDVITTPTEELSIICGLVYDLGDGIKNDFSVVGPSSILFKLTTEIEQIITYPREMVLNTRIIKVFIRNILAFLVDGVVYQLGRQTSAVKYLFSLSVILPIMGINENALDSNLRFLLKPLCALTDLMMMFFWQTTWWTIWVVGALLLSPIIFFEFMIEGCALPTLQRI
ncbi:MAG: dienelactone hydrolase family protein [Candidatus Thermoplasmatota archaeon]|nr:dienelactone hydrolase family protein [Candidatus Thermoplasmatota archaeon]